MDDSDREQEENNEISSRYLISKIKHDLPQLLFTRGVSSTKEADLRQGRHRRLVPELRVFKLAELLDQFQESPQLLDRHLSFLVSSLSDAFVSYVATDWEQYHHRIKAAPEIHVLPLPRAICRLLYSLCKVRGYKIIISLLNNDARFLEPLLRAFLAWNFPKRGSYEQQGDALQWEEKYVILLWLAHLMLLPFDLTTLISDDVCDAYEARFCSYLQLSGSSSVQNGLTNICLHYLQAPGKERDAARTLLVRLVLRSDQQAQDVPGQIVSWIMQLLHKTTQESTNSIYPALGALEFLTTFVKAADEVLLNALWARIWNEMETLVVDGPASDSRVNASVATRKQMTAFLRAFGSAVYQMRVDDAESILTSIIQYEFAALEDQVSQVRMSASKALSIIATNTHSDLAFQIAGEVLETLEEEYSDIQKQQFKVEALPRTSMASPLDFQMANVARWHGYLLTLAHMLYRRSVPVELLIRSLDALSLGINFNQESVLKTQLGTNVRDASCFGFWALVKRYTTSELQEAAAGFGQSRDVDQILHTSVEELVQASCFDNVGNIRRGASAALQELVGRHPDIIREGISLVQIIDYHGVATRSNAMMGIAYTSSQLGPWLCQSAVKGLFGWRGLKSPNAATRRLAAHSLGMIAAPSSQMVQHTLSVLVDGFARMPKLLDEMLHGKLCAIAAIVSVVHEAAHRHDLSTTGLSLGNSDNDGQSMAAIVSKQEAVWSLVDQIVTKNHPKATQSWHRNKKDEGLVQEATCRLIHSVASAVNCKTKPSLPSLTPLDHEHIDQYMAFVTQSLGHESDLVQKTAREAAHALLLPSSEPTRVSAITSWVQILQRPRSTQYCAGYMRALGFCFDLFDQREGSGLSATETMIIETLTELSMREHDIEKRCIALQGLVEGPVSSNTLTPSMVEIMFASLNDYTNDQEHGDIGSQVRMAATEMAGLALRRGLLSNAKGLKKALQVKLCSLATENIDKVRFEAATCIQRNAHAFDIIPTWPLQIETPIDTATTEYLTFFLRLATSIPENIDILNGLVTSAGGHANESLVQASAFAFASEAFRSTESLLAIAHKLLALIRDKEMDRVIIPSMEVMGYLFDIGALQQSQTNFPWRKLFLATAAAHYQSRDLRKLEAAVGIYHGLASVASVRQEVLIKLSTMLKIPFAKIRNLVADTLYTQLLSTSSSKQSQEESSPTLHVDQARDKALDLLLKTDFSAPPKESAAVVEELKNYCSSDA